eukprot:CAMPEP_0198328384 /NCGR_PEP_ID=MMETSP1450-20131203/15443_1 /TAXON_ID=753684 ORGANISM="Madagascaria erythrocladiodes, Strain CCMP3234" /NCGR_SAMPLE_ID=MMETSP1450 /ASSEMBLY_ACC=CAM_ASM_001115 /LENGTH=81 /DNA_ID=CAMNT_0044032517 /DNA_START=439 /DNA_END=681 /DNA_ORIENTATION=+
MERGSRPGSRSSVPAGGAASRPPVHRRSRSGASTSSLTGSHSSAPSARSSYSDRFIPFRSAPESSALDLHTAFDLLHTTAP